MRLVQHDDHVFINCPFDEAYRGLFEAIVFAVHDCGYVARCAQEIEDGGQVRIDKIIQIIGESRLGIHDLSRTGLDVKSRLPRFNMPLELGIFLGAKEFGGRAQKKKRCLILDCAPYRYQTFCSDIAGQDVKVHDNDVKKVIAVVRNWLRSTSGDVVIPGGVMIAKRHDQFRDDLPALCAKFHLHVEDLIFNDFTTLAVEWLKAHPFPRG